MAWRIQFRHDTAANWTSVNPVMMEGELGLEIDSGKFKLGNGMQAWNDLEYASGPAGPAGADGADGEQGPQGDPTTVNGYTGSSITLTAADVGALSAAALGVPNGVAQLDANGRLVQDERPVSMFLGAFDTDPTSGMQYGDYYFHYETINPMTNGFRVWVHVPAMGGTPATDAWIGMTEYTFWIGQPDGIAGLDGTGRLTQSQRAVQQLLGPFATLGDLPMEGVQYGDWAQVNDPAGYYFFMKGADELETWFPIYDWQSKLAQPDGLATLDGAGKVPQSQLPAYVSSHFYDAANQTEMLALPATLGDIVRRTDLNQQFMLAAMPPTTLANWKEFLTPPNTVLSVNTHTGIVSLTYTDVGADPAGAASSAQAAAISTAAGDATTKANAAQAAAISSSNGYTDTAVANEVTRANGAYLPIASSKVLPAGGAAGQILSKVDGTDYNTTWIDEAPAASYTSAIKHQVKLGEAIAKGQAVYVSSANGTNMIVSKASNDAETTSSKTMGLLETGGSTNAQVNVITEGLLAGLNTSTATVGDAVWLGTNGNLIFWHYGGSTTKPSAPAHLVFVGIVTRVHASQGEIFVKVQNGFELDELHNVSALTPANNDFLRFNSTTGLWENAALYGAANGVAQLDSNSRFPAGSLQQGTGLAVLGRNTNTGGAVGSIAAAADGDVLRRSGTSLAFGKIVPTSIDATGSTSGQVLASNGSAYVPTSITDAVIANNTISPSKLTQSGATFGQILMWNGSNWVPFNKNLDILVSNVLHPIAGTTVTNNTVGYVVYTRVLQGGPISKIGFNVGTLGNGTGQTVWVGVYSSTGTGRNAMPNTRLAQGSALTNTLTANAYNEISLGSTINVNTGEWLAFSINLGTSFGSGGVDWSTRTGTQRNGFIAFEASGVGLPATATPTISGPATAFATALFGNI
jgi:Major tropism determinant N-terminal domain